jgi:alcohol dehydrogenase
VAYYIIERRREMSDFDKAYQLLKEFRGENYIHGLGVLGQAGTLAISLGKRAALIAGTFPGSGDFIERITESLNREGVEVLAEIEGGAW